MTLILLRPDITIPQNENKKKRIFYVLVRTHRLHSMQSGAAKFKFFISSCLLLRQHPAHHA